jgi:hypothetical protein
MQYTDRSPSANGSGLGDSHGGNRHDVPEPYEAPRITRLGTLSELTLGYPTENGTDGSFSGSLFT